MNKHLTLIVTALLLAACGGSDGMEEPENSEPDRFPALSAADPLDWATVDRGTGLRSGSAVATAFQASAVYNEIQSTMPHVVIYMQAYDEAAPRLGEFVYNDPPTATVEETPATRYITEGNLARFENRVPDMADEIASADAEAGASGFESQSVVIDFWRLRRDWWVRWDGNLEDDANVRGKGPYGLDRQDMQEDLLDQIEAVAQAQKPRYFIVGDDMDLLLKADEGEGFSLADYSNFLQFFEKAVARIKTQSPDTKVGAGINWDRFVERVGPAYDAPTSDRNVEVLGRAFEAVIMPLVEAGDILALKSYRAPDDETITTYPYGDMTVTDSYQFLRRLESAFGSDKPVVFYAIGSPVDSPVGYLRQQNYLEAFVDWTAGVEPEFVAWRYMANLAGSQSADQMLGGTCKTLTEDPFAMPVSTCYDGLIDAVFSTKDPFDYLSETLSE